MPIPAPVEILLSPETQALFPVNLAAFENAVESEIAEEIGSVEAHLENYCQDPRGTVDDDSASVESVSIDSEGIGEMFVSFTESAHYGCKDADRSYEREMTLALRYDPATGLLRAFGHDIPERDTDDL